MSVQLVPSSPDRAPVDGGALVRTSRVRPPVPSIEMVDRERLLARVGGAVERAPLTLVCAPAGFGKTVLLSQWARTCGGGRPVAWLTVTDRDDQAGVFWSHVQFALVAAGVLDPDTPQPIYPDSADVDALAARLLGSTLPATLVIDGADHLHHQSVSDQIARLVEAAGSGLRLLVSARGAPRLPFHRYRLDGTVVEIGSAELALTGAEVEAVLAAQAISDPAGSAAAVLDRTAGWPAGVRMAALALASETADSAGEAAMSEYLHAEVISRVSDADRDLLVALSIVDGFDASLAVDLAERQEAADVVRRLSAANAFLEKDAGTPGGYRLHPVMRRVLSAELAHASPLAARALHRRAQQCFEKRGELVFALRHAVAAGSADAAVDLVTEQLMGAEGADALPSARAALDALEPSSVDGRRARVLAAIVGWLEGGARLEAGDLDDACKLLGAAVRAAAEGGRDDLRLRCTALLALGEACRGHLSRAGELADTADRLAVDLDPVDATTTSTIRLAHAWVAIERQDLARAQHDLDRLVRAGALEGFAAAVAVTLRARLLRDRGDHVGAREALAGRQGRPEWLSADAGGSTTQIGRLLCRADELAFAGDGAAARASVRRALQVAEPERVRRPFAHTSAAVRALIRSDSSLRSAGGWLRRETAAPEGSVGPVPIVSELSGRELEVLRHLSALLTTEEIAAEMFISVNTVKTHIRRILGKLSVSRRNEAVRRARELDIL